MSAGAPIVQWATNPQFRGGEKAKGQVIWVLDKPMETCELVVDLIWRTTGRGNRDGEQVLRVPVHRGRLEAGSHSLPFDVKLPKGPYSYQGRLFSIQWVARANLIQGLGQASWSEKEFDLKPAKKGPHHLGQSHIAHRPGGASLDAQPSRLRLMLGAAATLMALGVLATTVQNGLSGAAVVIFLLCGAIALGLFYGPLRRRLAEQNLGDVQVELSPDMAHPGGALNCKIHLAPRGGIEILDVECALRCEEIMVKGRNDDVRELTEGVYEVVESMPGVPTRLPAGSKTFSHQIALPRDIPLSFKSAEYEVLWTLTVLIDVEPEISWENTYTIVIAPR